jgi:hypothetical protein
MGSKVIDGTEIAGITLDLGAGQVPRRYSEGAMSELDKEIRVDRPEKTHGFSVLATYLGLDSEGSRYRTRNLGLFSHNICLLQPCVRWKFCLTLRSARKPLHHYAASFHDSDTHDSYCRFFGSWCLERGWCAGGET